MDATRFEQIARQLIQLLDQQMEALLNRGPAGFTSKNKSAYVKRKRKIRALRAQLDKSRASQ